MKLSSRTFYWVYIQLGLLLLSVLILLGYIDTTNWSDFLFLCIYGTVICLALNIMLCIIQRNIFTPITLVFLSFWIFQFGLPVVYVFVKDYSNFYINLFDYKTIINGAVYTVLSIQVFAVSISFYLMKTRKKSITIFDGIKWKDDTEFVSKAALFLFIVSGLIAMPLIIYSAYLTLKMGFFAANTRSYLSSNAIYRMVQAFFVPSGLLFLCFNTSRKKRGMLIIIILFFCGFQMLAGDRTNGLTGLLVILFFNVFIGKKLNFKVKAKKKKSIGTQALFGIVLCFILVLLVYIAKARVSDVHISLQDVFTNGLIKSFFGELGFNFTSICFVMKYVPSSTKFQYGLTYLSSLICLIPKSIDPSGTIENLSKGIGEVWLYNMNAINYGNLLNFGVGFSVIAESFYNFGWFGVFCFIIIGWVVAALLGKDLNDCNRFEKYVQLVLLFGFLTFPRRQVYDMLKDIEYSIFFIFIYISFIYYIASKKDIKK